MEKIKIISSTIEGRGVGKINGKVIFLENALPGEIVEEYVVTKKKKRYDEGVSLKISNTSEWRVEPFCQHYRICGGCQWQHAKYEYQLELKKDAFKGTLDKFLKIEEIQIEDVVPSPEIFHYRNRMDFSVGKNGEIGLHPLEKFDEVFDIQECKIAPQETISLLNLFRNIIKNGFLSPYDVSKGEGNLRGILLRKCQDGLFLSPIFFRKPDSNVINTLKESVEKIENKIVFFGIIINNKKNDSLEMVDLIPLKGSPILREAIDGLVIHYHLLSFFQVNSYLLCDFVGYIASLIKKISPGKLLDLYCGCGIFALMAAKLGIKSYGIEINKNSVEFAIYNKEYNGINNVEFLCAPCEDSLNFIEKYGKECIIVDPPRPGLHKKVVNKILDVRPKYIIYVSCNPATLGRDLAIFSNRYEIISIKPFDMFPFTKHIESVSLLKQKE